MIQPKDFLGRDINVGDTIACPRGSAHIEVARVEYIKFFVRKPYRGGLVEVPQHMAEGYTLHIRPIKSTRPLTMERKDGQPFYGYSTNRRVEDDPNAYMPKMRYIASDSVRAIVKLDPTT